jgi:hypothetical protein
MEGQASTDIMILQATARLVGRVAPEIPPELAPEICEVLMANARNEVMPLENVKDLLEAMGSLVRAAPNELVEARDRLVETVIDFAATGFDPQNPGSVAEASRVFEGVLALAAGLIVTYATDKEFIEAAKQALFGLFPRLKLPLFQDRSLCRAIFRFLWDIRFSPASRACTMLLNQYQAIDYMNYIIRRKIVNVDDAIKFLRQLGDA